MNTPNSYIDATTEETRQFNKRESEQTYRRRRGVLAVAGVVTLLTLSTEASNIDRTEYCVPTSNIANDANFNANLAASLREKGAIVADSDQLKDIPRNQAVEACLTNRGFVIGPILDQYFGYQAHVGSSEQTPEN